MPTHPLASNPPKLKSSTPKRSFLRLPPAARAALLEALTSNLESLAASAEALLEEWDGAAAGAVAAHRAAVKMHIFLLHAVATQAADEADRQAAAPAGAAAARPTAAGAKKKAGARRGAAAADDFDDDVGDQGPGGAWDWEWGRGAVLRSLRPALGADLRALFGGAAGVERAAGLALEIVSSPLGRLSRGRRGHLRSKECDAGCCLLRSTDCLPAHHFQATSPINT